MTPNSSLQPKVNGLPPLGLHFILAQSRGIFSVVKHLLAETSGQLPDFGLIATAPTIYDSGQMQKSKDWSSMMHRYTPGFVCSEQQLAIISTILATRSLDEYIAFDRGNRGFKPPSDPNLLHQFQPTLIELISTIDPQRELSHLMETGGYDPKVISQYFQRVPQRSKDVQEKDGSVDSADRIAGLLKRITTGLNTAYDLYKENYKNLNMDKRINNLDEHWMVRVFEATDWENLNLPNPDEHIRKAIRVYDGLIKQFARPSITEDAFKKTHMASFMNLNP